jgi:hypothetical protein
MKKATYDFHIDSIVCVDAPVGTDPDTLIEQAKQKLIDKINNDDIAFICDNIFENGVNVSKKL